jgi:FdhD protein
MTGRTRTRIVAIAGGERAERDDDLASEEPLEIRINGVAIAVVMRTPGDDEDLAMGFLLTERIVSAATDVVSIRHCTTVTEPEAEENVVLVVLAPDVDPPLEKLRRNLYASSSCGVCGKQTIAAALAHGGVVESTLRVSTEALVAMPPALRSAQATFEATGGIHGAALFRPTGALALSREDVGRHNAVDKVVGAAARAGLSGSEHVLLVSGRVGFEIVQKAAAFGVPVVAGISAPSSLAVRFGAALGVTVVGFLRGESMNVYAHPHRIVAG